ncbi:hypothetical protein OG373_36560 [Streptomyces avidinii]|uniref:hypothetical protein n=1 Tax=Streptomyces avidinii TaxID=1895 RepID=UPI003869F189|nr:hypothetical protein OG373_36560 [Streptomyces avidinii]
MSPRADSRTEAATPAARTRDADAMAVTGFVLGLVGLLVMNVILGPTAVVLGALALRRHTTRPGRAWSCAWAWPTWCSSSASSLPTGPGRGA